MKFHYKALDSKGKTIEADIEERGVPEALAAIAAQGLRPLSLKQVNQLSLNVSKWFEKKITLEDKVFLTKYLSLMLRVGTDLFRAINILIEDFEKDSVRRLLIEIRGNLEKGSPFYTTFAKYPKTFSQVFVSLVRAGEVSGNLEGVFNDLSSSLEREKELNSKIKSALTYPVILLGGSVIILFLLVSYALPKIANVFLSGGMTPPAFSRIVFSIGLFMGDHLMLISFLLLLTVFGGYMFFGKSQVGKKVLYDIALRIPVIKRIIRETSLQRMAATLSSLLSSGLPIIEALDVTADAVSVPELKQALKRIAHERVAKGATVGEAFKSEVSMPVIVSNLIAISEKSGHLEEILATLADFYSGEVQNAVKTMVSFIEPVMLLFIGLVIGVIALAVIVPVYQLTNTF